MRRHASALLAALALSSAIAAGAGTTDVITCASDLNRVLASADSAGRTFDITAKMVNEHLNAIFMKLGAANRTEAVAIALRKHLLKF